LNPTGELPTDYFKIFEKIENWMGCIRSYKFAITTKFTKNAQRAQRINNKQLYFVTFVIPLSALWLINTFDTSPPGLDAF